MYFKNLLKVCGFILMLCFVVPAMAQNKTITGKVTDSKDGSPIIGASVVSIPAGSGGSVTDVNGDYKITVTTAATSLSVSYIGYNKKTIAIDGKSVINVALESNTSNLNEVVVVGYGTQKVKDATGSVASIGPRDFNKGLIATPDQLLQGRISGVQVTPASGEPGGGASILIRGTSSIRSGSDPLYVVDGVPIENSGTSGNGFNTSLGSSSARNPLEFINPADIENISVLKDASASAIYGSRGANGVILITTKKGSKGQGIQLASNTTIANTASRYDLMNAAQFYTAATKAGADPTVFNQLAFTDWQDQIFRTGVSQNYTLGFGGAKDGFTYRASGSIDDENGIVKKSGLNRLTARLNASQNLLNDRLKFDLNFLVSNVKNTYAPIGDNSGFQGSLIGAAIIANPTYPITNPNGTYFFDGSSRNPVAILNLTDDNDNINRYLTNLSASLKIVKNLTYKATFGDDYSTGKRSTFINPALQGFTDGDNVRGLSIDNISTTGVNGQIGTGGRGIIQNVQLASIITEHTLTYDVKFKDNSALTALAGYSYQQTTNYQWNIIGQDAKTPTSFENNIDAFNKFTPVFGDSTKTQLQSYFGRVNYSFKDKYLLTATVRRDGSSKFGTNNKYATFPAFAAKWKIMNESFAPKSIFDDLSLRLNWGQTGNQDFPPYASLLILQRQFDGGQKKLNDANPDLKWESTTQYGAGIDFALFNNRLTGTIDYFHKDATNTLFLRTYAQPSNASQRWVNLPGDIINKGVEVALNLDAIKGKDFSWSIAYNMTFLNNQVKNFGNLVVNTGAISGQGLSGAYGQIIKNNYPLFTYNLPIWLGYDNNGNSIFQGKNPDYTKNNDQSFILDKSAIPTFTAGLTNTFNFKRLTFSTFINGSSGFYVYNNTANAYFYRGNLANSHNSTVAVGNSSEATLDQGSQSTRFLERGDFIRLSNATLSYNFDLNGSKFLKTFRVGLSGQNLILITGYTGLDPEVNVNKNLNNVPSRGFDYASYPKARTYTFSINAGF